jgi:hypothetical protein
MTDTADDITGDMPTESASNSMVESVFELLGDSWNELPVEPATELPCDSTIRLLSELPSAVLHGVWSRKLERTAARDSDRLRRACRSGKQSPLTRCSFDRLSCLARRCGRARAAGSRNGES